MTTEIVGQMWELAISGSSLMTRALAVVRLSDLDPDHVEDLYRKMNVDCPIERGNPVISTQKCDKHE